MKIYAKELDPESFDYRVYEDMITEDPKIIIEGGREFCNFNDNLLKKIDNLYSEYDTYDFEYQMKKYYDNSIKKFISDYIKKENKKDFSNIEVKRIVKALKSNDIDIIRVECLSVIKGEEYQVSGLRGSCQGDYVELFSPKNTSQEYIDWIEAWYFGTGIEVMIHTGDWNNIKEPKSPEEVEGYTFYTSLWKSEDIKKEIKKLEGYKPEDNVEIVFWKYTGSHTIKIPHYELA